MNSQSLGSLYKSIFDNTPDGLSYCRMIFDEQKKPVDFLYLEINKNFEKLTGLKNIVGKRITDLVPKILFTNPELFYICGRVSLSGGSERFELYIEALKTWFLVSVYSTKKNFFVSVFQNITDRKTTEKNLENAKIAARNVLEDLQFEKGKLAEAKAKDEALLESIGEGVVATDQDGKVIIMSKVAEELLGFTIQNLVEKPFVQTVSIKDAQSNPIPDAQHPMVLAMTLGKTINNTYYFVHKNGTKFPAAITATPVILDKKPIGAIIVFRDITKEKKIDQAKTEFISLASHQLRTPLSSVNWYAEMLLAGDVGELNTEQKKYLEEVYRGNQRMVDLVNAILNISRLELGTFAVEPVSTDIGPFVQSIIDEQKQDINKKKIKFSSSIEEGISKVVVDPKLLRMVVQNLLANSIKYTPNEGKIGISLSLDKEKGKIEIKVSDTGYGIPKNQQDKIFTKFFRADNVRDKDTEGTGLGLYIIKSIIEKSGGKIWFDSIENKGTTFYSTFSLEEINKKTE